jgi:UDP-N-acetyl-D-glucosamine/UDP-N-acetyl-D-galactosamine dehydrogenase
MSETIAVIGLGYVGLPLLLGLARHFSHVVGFDIDARRVAALQQGTDWTGEVSAATLVAAAANFTTDPAALADCSIIIVTVPTPIDGAKRPDLTPILSACDTIGRALRNRPATPALVPLIVFESTVYPGLTEEVCAPRIAAASGKQHGIDFKLGYSPERINPGDIVHKLETITKVVAAEDAESLARLAAIYGAVVTAGLHLAPSIAVAEAAKVLENTQRDLNVALMNELALICDRLNIRTTDVLAAAGTKWNFLKFTPGLVGGHCIGVDPYYLTTRAEALGYHPQVILAGRRINDTMPQFIAEKLVKLLVTNGALRSGVKVGVLGLSFKENVRDLRNSRVPDIITALQGFGCAVQVHDPLADPAHAQHEYGLTLSPAADLTDLAALIVAVPHAELLAAWPEWETRLPAGGVVMDIKSALTPSQLRADLIYWSL